eukprot:Nitzschia sp. Nitz4//scaffold202_size38995//8194//10190//NITZ4_007628-RA/size38995-augustus-gene-0.55-mRNA-1//-1//CDS//3329541372//1537//frame0
MGSPSSKKSNWTVNDDKSLDDLLGTDDFCPPTGTFIPLHDDTGMQAGPMMILPDFDDISAIPDDSVVSIWVPPPPPSEYPHNPEKPRDYNGEDEDEDLEDYDLEKDCFHDDDTTCPETPLQSNSAASFSVPAQYQFSRQLLACSIVAALVTVLLVGAIVFLGLKLSNRKGTADTPNPIANWTIDDFDFVPVFGDPSSSPTGSPTLAYIENLGAKELYITDAILEIAPSSFRNNWEIFSSAVELRALRWLASDPSLYSYTPQRLMQRFALACFYWSLSPNTTLTKDWMAFTDECTWSVSRATVDLCDETGNVTSIYFEDMQGNGTIASELGLLPHLKMLFLTSNDLHGTIPSQLSWNTALHRLNLARNELKGTIPTELGILPNLGVLGLGHNDLTGTVPSEIGNLSKLGSLVIPGNSFHGTIPSTFGNLAELQYLHVQRNNLEGEIPSAIGGCVSLKELLLQENVFTGTVPSSVCALNTLERAVSDCAKLTCTCCEECSADGGATDSVATSGPTSGTTSCAWIRTGKECYFPEEIIDIQSYHCTGDALDVVTLYKVETSALQASVYQNSIFWVQSCADLACQAELSDGIYQREDGLSQTLNSAWPMEEAEYQLLLLRVAQPGSMELLAQSEVFTISVDCQ